MSEDSRRSPVPDLDDLIDRDKRSALAGFDGAALGAAVRRRLAGHEAPAGLPARPWRRLSAVVVTALAVVAAVVAGVVVSRPPRIDSRMVARALGRATFYAAPDLDSPAAVAARRVAPGRESVLAWTVQAAIYRAHRDEAAGPVPPLTQTIVAALAGAGPGRPEVWPDIDAAALARRIDAVRRSDVLLRALGAAP